jgi:hypothetical protein
VSAKEQKQMKRSPLFRYALSCCAIAAMLAGCGGSQSPIGAPGAMPQSSTIATRADLGKSWMLPGSSSGDLIYATGGSDDGLGDTGGRGPIRRPAKSSSCRARPHFLNFSVGNGARPGTRRKTWPNALA